MFPMLTQESVMSPLRKQMEADMVVRGLAYRTREAYVESVAKLAKFYGKGSGDPARAAECFIDFWMAQALGITRLNRAKGL
jgi:hypothetical protein